MIRLCRRIWRTSTTIISTARASSRRAPRDSLPHLGAASKIHEVGFAHHVVLKTLMVGRAHPTICRFHLMSFPIRPLPRNPLGGSLRGLR